jgi:hypothetical protein
MRCNFVFEIDAGQSCREKVMVDRIEEFEGVRVLECATEGSSIRGSQDAINLIGEARSHQATIVAIPATRLSDDFFRLGKGIAGEFIQKFVTYGLRLVVLGDISEHVDNSSALRNFVYEANRGAHCWFLTDRDELGRRLQNYSLRKGGPAA